MSRSYFAVTLAILFLFTTAHAQKAEVSISLNEPFFDALLDSIYQNFDPPEFSLSQVGPTSTASESPAMTYGFAEGQRSKAEAKKPFCTESIKILREINGVRTSVRFRDGKIYVPLAFSGGYAPPFVGCVDFSGWAESNIDLEFDKDAQRLVGRVRVLSVNLSGTGGVGGSLIAKMLQGSIDKKLNPINILTLDKLAFAVPVSKSGNLQMKATAVRNEIVNGALNVVVTFQFSKA